jgi:hypothetical protein
MHDSPLGGGEHGESIIFVCFLMHYSSLALEAIPQNSPEFECAEMAKRSRQFQCLASGRLQASRDQKGELIGCGLSSPDASRSIHRMG